MDFMMGFDPGSLLALTRLMGFGALLDPNVLAALVASGTLLVTAAVGNTWSMFANPTGTLASSIYFWVAGPMEVDIAVGVPYGRRREFGFSGMTDSLGRFFADDPGKPYMENALADNQDAVLALMKEAVLQTFVEVGAV